MISIIVCSTKPNSLSEFRNNIEHTVGLDFELIIIDNSANDYSIFSAYNKGVRQSKYATLCFVHEDVHFWTQDWGKLVCKHLEDETCGFLGICGGNCLPVVPASWSLFGMTKHIIQSYKTRDNRDFCDTGDFNHLFYHRAVALDGVFLCVRKSLFDQLSFDENRYDGFHYYDIDISLQAHVLGYENRVVNNILIEHFSTGYRNEKWIESGQIFIRKWKKVLPVMLDPISNDSMNKRIVHFMTGTYLKTMIKANYSDRLILETLKDNLAHLPLSANILFLLKLRVKIKLQRLLKKPLTLFAKRINKFNFSDVKSV